MSYYVVAKQWHLYIVSISLLLAALAYLISMDMHV